MNNSKEQNKPIYKKWWFWVLIVLVIFAIIPGKKQASSVETTTSEASSEATSENASASDSLNEPNKDPLLSYFTEATGIKEAEVTEKDDYIEIVYTLTDLPYDYTDYVSKGLTHFVKTAKLIYSNTDCDMLRMDMKSDDSIVTSFIITRENFNSIDWSALAYTEGIYDQVKDKFQKFYVESMLMKNVDTNKIMYKGE